GIGVDLVTGVQTCALPIWLFSVRLLIETGKSLLKLTLYTTIAWFVIQGVRRNELITITDANRLAHAMGAAALKLLVLFAAVAVRSEARRGGISSGRTEARG